MPFQIHRLCKDIVRKEIENSPVQYTSERLHVNQSEQVKLSYNERKVNFA